MRIFAIYRHYWPDATPYARLLKSILEDAAASGQEVVAYAAQPSYNDLPGARRPARETVGGVAIRRIALLPERKRWVLLRAINEAYFIVRALAHVMFRGRYGVIIANGRPPLLTGCALWLLHAITGVPYILHLQDIHPECLQAVGKLPNGHLFRVLRWIDGRVCRGAEQIVTLSGDMAQTLRERGLDMRRVSVINNAPLPLRDELPDELPAAFRRIDGAPLLLFAGNLGDFQGLELVVDAAKQLVRERPFRLIFLGAGAARRRLMDRAEHELNCSILFEPYASPATAVRAMQASDFGIVSLAAGVYRCAYPSKLMTYLSAGCPVVALVEPQSELVRTVAEHELGVAAAGLTLEGAVDALRTACEASTSGKTKSCSEIALAGESIFGEKRMLLAWRDVLASVEHGHRCSPPQAGSGEQSGQLAA